MRKGMLPHEAAKVLGITPERVRQLVDNGRLPAKRGDLGVRFISAEAVARLAAEREERKRERAAAAR